MLVWIHVVAGSIALLAGAIALSAAKGAPLHRRAGIAFVYAMLVMSGLGAVVAAMISIRVSITAGALTFYLVATALVTVRRPLFLDRRFDMAAMLWAGLVGISAVYWGIVAMFNPKGTLDGYPPAPFFIFGSVALIAATLDIRMLVSGVNGKHRIARHLWRMGFAMYIATSAFFLGQAKLFPEPVLKIALLAIPVVLVMLLTLYWLVRVLVSKNWQRK